MPSKSIENKIQLLSLNELKPYKDAPFKVRMDNSMNELVESVKEKGFVGWKFNGGKAVANEADNRPCWIWHDEYILV